MRWKSWAVAVAGIALIAGSARAGTFGTVVPIGGEAADVALDEARGVLYIANFTANRIDIMSLANNTITDLDQRRGAAKFHQSVARRPLADRLAAMETTRRRRLRRTR